MKAIFDSSAILNLASSKSSEELLDGSTISLARYELGNALWNQVANARKMSLREASRILESLFEVLLLMDKAPEPRPGRVLDLSVKEKLTYYDAAYLVAALESGLTLVTDDALLRRAASRHVKTVSTSDV